MTPVTLSPYNNTPVILGGAKGSAMFGPGGLESPYRYWLSRDLEDTAGLSRTVGFIMLNPSTAHHDEDDPTIRRCIGFAKAWGASRLLVGNLFAYRSTDPAGLYTTANPIGSANEGALLNIGDSCGMGVVCAWGAQEIAQERGDKVRLHLSMSRVRLFYLRLTKSGAPAHPLYLPKNLKPTPWNNWET